MKKILLSALLAVASVLPMHAQTILVVDVSGVFNNLIEVKAELNKMNSTADTYRNYLNSQGQALLDMQNKATALQTQAENPANLPESRDAYRAQFTTANADMEKKKQEIQSFYTQSNDLIQKNQQALVQSQLEKIKAAVADIAAKKKATLVLNSSALGMLAPVVFNDKSTMDITDDVLKTLNDAATAAAPAAAAAPAPMAAPSMTAKPAATTGMAPAKPAATK
jgi:outer membrane protein